MALPVAGQISMSQIQQELGLNGQFRLKSDAYNTSVDTGLKIMNWNSSVSSGIRIKYDGNSDMNMTGWYQYDQLAPVTIGMDIVNNLPENVLIDIFIEVESNPGVWNIFHTESMTPNSTSNLTDLVTAYNDNFRISLIGQNLDNPGNGAGFYNGTPTYRNTYGWSTLADIVPVNNSNFKLDNSSPGDFVLGDINATGNWIIRNDSIYFYIIIL
jgi:hypothetical protein